MPSASGRRKSTTNASYAKPSRRLIASAAVATRTGSKPAACSESPTICRRSSSSSTTSTDGAAGWVILGLVSSVRLTDSSQTAACRLLERILRESDSAMAMPRTDAAAKAFEILVIDDEPEIRELLTEHLRARGYRTATAGDGLAAVSLLQRS